MANIESNIIEENMNVTVPSLNIDKYVVIYWPSVRKQVYGLKKKLFSIQKIKNLKKKIKTKRL